ncbi:hypothetical protein [Paraburkholderia dinghuensis]|nr:hypothetical protein [Paraburkholderia dinghuensis]
MKRFVEKPESGCGFLCAPLAVPVIIFKAVAFVLLPKTGRQLREDLRI